MAFRAASIVMAPDGDPQRHRAKVSTSRLEITLVVVGVMDFDQAAEVCKELVQKEGVQSISLCPGFTYAGVAKVASAVGDNVAVTVSRADVPSMMVTAQVLAQEGWLPESP